MSGSLCVRVESDAAVVAERLRDLPSDLVRGPFQHPAWIAAWLDAHAPSPPPMVLATISSDDGTLVFVLPLMLDTRAGLPCWTALDDGVADYNAPMITDAFRPSPTEMRRLWALVLEQLPGGDLVFLEKMPARIGDRRNPMLDLDGVAASRFRRHPLSLGGGIEVARARYLHGRTVARKRRKLARHGALDYVELSGAAAVASLERLMGWRERRYDTRPILADFYRRVLLSGDLGRLGMLRLDGEEIAGCFGIVDGGVLRLLVIAFDGRFSGWSPGLLAVDAAIGRAVEAGLDEFDFTIGSEPYKLDFGATSEPLWEMRAALGLRGRLMLGLLGARRIAATIVRRSRHRRRPSFVGDAEAARAGS